MQPATAENPIPVNKPMQKFPIQGCGIQPSTSAIPPTSSTAATATTSSISKVASSSVNAAVASALLSPDGDEMKVEGNSTSESHIAPIEWLKMHKVGVGG